MPRVLRPGSAPVDGNAYSFFFGASAVEAALIEQRGFKPQTTQSLGGSLVAFCYAAILDVLRKDPVDRS